MWPSCAVARLVRGGSNGRWRTTPRARVGWTGCEVPVTNARLTQGVGETLSAHGMRRRGSSSAPAWTLGLIAAANAAVIMWLWLAGGGVSAVHTVGDLWTSIGRVTG